jgi:membrane-associated phospholipid phosphatase
VRFFTDFADQAVMLPLVMAVAITLAVQGWRRGAFIWLAAIGGTFLAVAALKFSFLSCQPVFGPWHIASPSGHVAAATVVTAGLAWLLSRGRPTILTAAAIVAVFIGWTRLLLHAHSVPEVLIGGAIGLTGATLLLRCTGAPPPIRPIPLLGVITLVVVLFHGLHLGAEAAIRRNAHNAWFIPACRVQAD